MNHTDNPECRNCIECANRDTCKTFYGSYICRPKKKTHDRNDLSLKQLQINNSMMLSKEDL